jgi:5-methylcytosine-specific restriction endonuclease McrA
MPSVLRRYCQGNTLSDGTTTLHRHTSFTTQHYKKRFFKPNPYTTQERIVREELPDTTPWLGIEPRPGMADVRLQVLQRDNYTCLMCKDVFPASQLEVDHIRPYRCFKRPVDANRPDNLWTLCIPCHTKKTELDRQRESRMP